LNLDIDKAEYTRVTSPQCKSHSTPTFFFPFLDNPSTIKYNYQNVKHDRVRRGETKGCVYDNAVGHNVIRVHDNAISRCHFAWRMIRSLSPAVYTHAGK